MSQEQAKQALGSAFKSERKELMLTQKELADQLGVSTVHVSYIENGTRLPSKKLLKKLFSIEKGSIPPRLIELLEITKSKVRAPQSTPDTIYDLKTKGFYTAKALKQLLKEHPDNLIYIMGLFHFYKEQGDFKKAEQILTKSQSHIKTLEHRKWLKAYSLQIQNNFDSYIQAIALMEEAITIFDVNNPVLTPSQRKEKSEMLFRYATIHFDFGVYLFFKLSPKDSFDRAKIQEQFEKSLEKHHILRQYYLYPYSQLDYANIHYWLATLMNYEKEEQNKVKEITLWQTFIEESKAAIFLNYSEKLERFPDPSQGNLFTPEFMLLNVSFLALAHGRLALLKSETKEIQNHLKEAELLWATHTLDPLKSNHVKYRYYYNFAHFYSIKAQILNEFSLESIPTQTETMLNLCAKAIHESEKVDKNAFRSESQLPSEFYFYKQQRPHEFQKTIGENL